MNPSKEKKYKGKAKAGKGRKCEQRKLQDEALQQRDSSDMNIRGQEMAAKDKVQAKDEIKDASYYEKRGAKPKIRTVAHTEAKAGPSGLNISQKATVVKNKKLESRDRFPLVYALNPKQPYELERGGASLIMPSPRKGILKKFFTEDRIRPRLRFSQATVYYFKRLVFRPKPECIFLSMEQEHFYTNLLSVNAYEKHKKIHPKGLLPLQYLLAAKEKPCTYVLQLRSTDDDIVLRTIHMPAELMNDNDKKVRIVEKVYKGCSCKIYCNPATCQCSLIGRQCEVFEDDFPCGCQLEYCKNRHGRQAYNNKNVKNNNVSVANAEKPATVVKEIQGGRVNKRKQYTPTRYTGC